MQNYFAFSQLSTEGILSFKSYVPFELSDLSTNRKDSMIMQEKKMWFKDSTVIYALRTHLTTTVSTNEGIATKKSFPVWKYIYLDMRTQICQDYLTLSDTAEPFNNYKLTYGETPSILSIFLPTDIKNTLREPVQLSDTIVNNKIFKRVKALYKYYEYEKSYSIYYIDCSVKYEMINMNRTINTMFPNCFSSKLEFYDSTQRVIIREEIIVERDTLTESEKKIFEKWKNNAKNTKLPLLTASEAISIPIGDPAHEDPIIITVTKH